MALELDTMFNTLVEKFFGKSVDEISIEKLDKIIKPSGKEFTSSALNIIKASHVLNTPFSECYELFKENYITTGVAGAKFSTMSSRQLYFLALTIRYLRSVKEEIMEMGSRNVILEVVAEKYKVDVNEVDQKMVDSLLNNSNDVYSVTDEPVKSWDEYFFNVCRQSARNSKCLSRRIGAVLVKDKSIISTGYNGPPRGVPRCDKRWFIDPEFIATYDTDKSIDLMDTIGKCPRHVLGAKSGELTEMCVAGHAEENAILNAAWHGIATKGATLYLTCGIPCFRCVIKIINAGISEIVVTGLKFYDDNSKYLLNNSTVKVRLYDF